MPRRKQNTHEARFSREATRRVHRSRQWHASYFFPPRTSTSLEAGRRRAPQDGGSANRMAKEDGNRDRQGCAGSRGYLGKPHSLSGAGIPSSRRSWHVPLPGGEQQWPLLHSPQHYQQSQKDFPLISGVTICQFPPFLVLGYFFFLIFFFFVLILQTNVYHSLKQLLDAAAWE